MRTNRSHHDAGKSTSSVVFTETGYHNALKHGVKILSPGGSSKRYTLDWRTHGRNRYNNGETPYNNHGQSWRNESIEKLHLLSKNEALQSPLPFLKGEDSPWRLGSWMDFGEGK